MAYVGPANKPKNKELYDLFHARGVMCMISAAPTHNKLPDPTDRKKLTAKYFSPAPMYWSRTYLLKQRPPSGA